MKQQWEKLIAVLDEMLALYRAILSLSQEKRSILVAADGQKLEQITKQEELLILQAGKLEKRREKVISEIGASQGFGPSETNISKLKELTDDTTAKRLDEISEQLTKVFAELGTVNEVNTKLIKQALVFVNYNINILAQSTTSPTYAPEGKSGQTGNSRNWVDRKV
ncbi:hypothetical protein SDC9_93945 [bioreactor metagenome]|uniref:FlgN protein n=1 Tax=bioreactor metagenome TaxID=1076179 RepID=A0A645A2E1_9ZZZZ